MDLYRPTKTEAEKRAETGKASPQDLGWFLAKAYDLAVSPRGENLALEVGLIDGPPKTFNENLKLAALLIRIDRLSPHLNLGPAYGQLAEDALRCLKDELPESQPAKL